MQKWQKIFVQLWTYSKNLHCGEEKKFVRFKISLYSIFIWLKWNCIIQKVLIWNFWKIFIFRIFNFPNEVKMTKVIWVICWGQKNSEWVLKTKDRKNCAIIWYICSIVGKIFYITLKDQGYRLHKWKDFTSGHKANNKLYQVGMEFALHLHFGNLYCMVEKVLTKMNNNWLTYQVLTFWRGRCSSPEVC